MSSPEPRKHDFNQCGCCQGLTASTPVEIVNRPGLSAIAYRVGIHPQFKASMLAALSDGRYPALADLRTREDDDFSIALLDAWAAVADVLTFYQERIANELYLGTAIERRSIGWLARLIGYQLRPGVAASTCLAYTLESATGAPSQVTIDETVKVQSVPGPGEKPQVFEPVEEITARPEWNALYPRLTIARVPVLGDTSLYLEGVATNLKPGDCFVIAGLEREQDPTSDRWEFRKIGSVEADAAAGRTLLTWQEALGSYLPRSLPPAESPRFYAMRLRAAIFGHNAPEWSALPVALRVGEANPDPKTVQKTPFLQGAFADRQDSWADAKFASNTTVLNLDAVYNTIVPDSWIALTTPDHNYAELYRVTSVAEETIADFNISAKTTRLEISGENIQKYSPRKASVFAQSDELAMAETPITDPVSGSEIVLDREVEGLEQNRRLIVQGKRARVEVAERGASYRLEDAAGTLVGKLEEGDSLLLLDAPQPIVNQPKRFRWHVLTADGIEGYASASGEQLAPAEPLDGDPVLVEAVTLDKLVAEDEAHTRLVLNETLAYTYDRASFRILANVVLATHGETVKEVLGSGDAGEAFQKFTLLQSPLTYTPSDTPSGGATTLKVWVNGIRWKEAASLPGAGARDRVYIARTDDDDVTTVQFGDGVTGERLPKGSENVTAVYRKGIGRDGMVKANQLSQLMVRPLGLSKVTNPLAASGAQDRQKAQDARENAPLTVLTLDRIVSLRDYEDFARSFSGIAKALATWTWDRRTRGVLLTVSGVDGAEVLETSETYKRLRSAILEAGDPRVPVVVKSYRKAYFTLSGAVTVDPDYQSSAAVLANVIAALRGEFSFDARAFGQPVALSEAIALIQNVAGVVAVDVKQFYRTDRNSSRETILLAETPQPGDDSSVLAAELLTLDPAPLEGLVAS